MFNSIGELKEFLKQAYRIDKLIQTKENEIEIWQTKRLKITTSFSERVEGTKELDPIVGATIKIIDLQNELNQRIDELVDIKTQIVRLIDGVQGNEYKLLLELRYLSFKSWEKIAVEMNYNWRTVFKVHNRALQEILKLGSQGQ